MLNTETVFEYYHNITLFNGTTLSIPAGRSAFIPASSPVVTGPSRHTSGPESTVLYSDRLDEDLLDKEMTRHAGPRAPDCVSPPFVMTILLLADLSVRIRTILQNQGDGHIPYLPGHTRCVTVHRGKDETNGVYKVKTLLYPYTSLEAGMVRNTLLLSTSTTPWLETLPLPFHSWPARIRLTMI
jgi:hypothetical protein